MMVFLLLCWLLLSWFLLVSLLDDARSNRKSIFLFCEALPFLHLLLKEGDLWLFSFHAVNIIIKMPS
jgi:hypothetical protein